MNWISEYQIMHTEKREAKREQKGGQEREKGKEGREKKGTLQLLLDVLFCNGWESLSMLQKRT